MGKKLTHGRSLSLLGANAIMGLRWDYSYIGGDWRSLLMLVATGTACRVSGMNRER
ncbi:MAG: heavy metal-binding domain-containing protein [Nitrospirae bacterium]|nr:heavy metal-binding domain-containing protein [Nitrospirota bacterium]